MSSLLVAGMSAGGFAGLVVLLFAHVAPRFAAPNQQRQDERSWVLRLPLQPTIVGKVITHREAHLIGILAHCLLSVVFGGLFTLGVDRGVYDIGLVSYGSFWLLMTLITGLCILPLEGHGLFGKKRDEWMGIDMALTNFFWMLLYATTLSLWNR